MHEQESVFALWRGLGLFLTHFFFFLNIFSHIHIMNAFLFLSLNNMKHENLHRKIAWQVHSGCFPPGNDEKEGGGIFMFFKYKNI